MLFKRIVLNLPQGEFFIFYWPLGEIMMTIVNQCLVPTLGSGNGSVLPVAIVLNGSGCGVQATGGAPPKGLLCPLPSARPCSSANCFSAFSTSNYCIAKKKYERNVVRMSDRLPYRRIIIGFTPFKSNFNLPLP